MPQQRLSDQEADAIRDKWFRVFNWGWTISLLAFYVWFRIDRLQEAAALTEAAAESVARLAFIFGLVVFLVGMAGMIYARIRLYGWDFLVAHSWADYRLKDQWSKFFAIGIIVFLELLIRAKIG